ncbi:MAG: Maf family protein [Desulfobacterium sp.]|nr:Maf family protein [Desulfobacterium sp.]
MEKDKSNLNRLILASQSPRRSYLLEQAGISFDVIPADIQEKMIEGEHPESYVQRLSREKAQFIAGRHPQRWVLGADTVVVIDDRLLEKPNSRKNAVAMLKRLSNRTHTVYTGFTICCLDKSTTITRSVATRVKFKQLTDREIEWYTNTDEPFDKAGAYAIQGLGTFLVKSIDGSYTNVVGLPVCEVIEILLEQGVITLSEMGNNDE